MRDYELTLILKPDLGEEGLTAATERISGWITGTGGEIVKVTPAGRKRLAFPIEHFRDASYVLLQLRTRPEAIPEVERNLKITDSVLRHMFIRR